MKKSLIILLFFFSFFSFKIISAQQHISRETDIYILTCSPGEEIYQVFGHTTFWIVDDSTRLNYIYHYGTFNYADPNFYLNFIKGRLNYMLALESYPAFIQEYSNDGRDVYKYKLNLTYNQKVKLYEFLTWKSKPENRYYMYDFFLDNCATRVRDVLENIYGDSLVYPDIKIDLTYREAIKPYMQGKPWLRFGTNLVLGMPTDKKLDAYSAMFLPDYIDTVICASKLKTPSGLENLGFNRSYLIQSNYEINKKPFFNPTYFFWFLLFLTALIIFIEYKKEKKFKAIDFTLLFVTGLTGIIILFMWFGTDHSPVKWNLNILWAFPTHIITAFLIFKQKFDLFVKKYLFIFSIINIILAITMWFLLPQKYDTAIFPFLLILILRFGSYLMFAKK